MLAQVFFTVRGVFDYAGGPLNSDLLVSWEEYGAVLAAYLVKKPGSATVAMTINGFGQFLIDGSLGPHHLLYGVSGLGADFVFLLFRNRRYDVGASALAGIACQAFWIPVTYTYHQVFAKFSMTFILGDIATRVVGGAIGDGLLGAGLGFIALWGVGHARNRLGSSSPSAQRRNSRNTPARKTFLDPSTRSSPRGLAIPMSIDASQPCGHANIALRSGKSSGSLEYGFSRADML